MAWTVRRSGGRDRTIASSLLLMSLMAASSVAEPRARATAAAPKEAAARPSAPAARIPHGEVESDGDTAVSGPHLSLDVFGGFSFLNLQRGEQDEDGDERATSFNGWDVGATIRPVRWLGLGGSYGRHSKDGVRFAHVLGGLRATTDFGDTDLGQVRGSGHVLFGRVSLQTPGSPSEEASSELVVGIALDFLAVVRLQLDYARFDLPGYPRDNFRGFFGIAVPLCFSGCRKGDTVRWR